MSDIVSKADERVQRFLQAGKSSTVVDPQQAQLDIVRRILAGDSVEDVLKQQEATHARDVLDMPIRVVGTRYQESAIEGDGPDFYMLIDCASDNGEPYSITCGAVNVMAQLHRLGELDAFPLVVKLVEVGKPTKAGYKPMWAELVPNADKTFDPFAKASDF